MFKNVSFLRTELISFNSAICNLCLILMGFVGKMPQNLISLYWLNNCSVLHFVRDDILAGKFPKGHPVFATHIHIHFNMKMPMASGEDFYQIENIFTKMT